MALDVKTKELIAVGAAATWNCMPYVELHCKECIQLGISVEDIQEAIETARTAKNLSIKKIDELVREIV